VRVAIRGKRRGFGRALGGFSSILLMLAGASAAAAQTETRLGSRLPRTAPADIPTYGMSKDDAARVTLLAFGRCTVQEHRALVERTLVMPALDGATDKAIDKFMDDDCLRDGQLRMPTSLARGSLYAALYLADFGNAPAVAPFAAPLDFSGDVGGATTPEAQQYLALHQFADCVVRDDPADSRALLLARIGTQTENAVFAALAPHFNACIVQGQSLTFSKAVLTALIAEVLYRHSKAAAQPHAG